MKAFPKNPQRVQGALKESARQTYKLQYSLLAARCEPDVSPTNTRIVAQDYVFTSEVAQGLLELVLFNAESLNGKPSRTRICNLPIKSWMLCMRLNRTRTENLRSPRDKSHSSPLAGRHYLPRRVHTIRTQAQCRLGFIVVLGGCH